MITNLRSFFILFALIATPLCVSAQETEEESTFSDTIYNISTRVIFAKETGIYGNLPQELQDMRSIFNKQLRYPSYTLWNSIQLSFFGDEDATALVFPEHYLRLTPKGSNKAGDKVKLKVELFYIPDEGNTTTKLYVPSPEEKIPATTGDLAPLVGIEEREDSDKPLLPILSSAMIVETEKWRAFGGVPVRVNLQERVSSNTLSSNPITSPGVSQAVGQKRYLILGVKLTPEEF